MTKLYASLTGPLLGVFYPLPTDDEILARRMLNSSKLKNLWCSVYTVQQIWNNTLKMRLPAPTYLDDSFAQKLDYDRSCLEGH